MASASSSSSYSPFESTSNNIREDSFSSYQALIRQSFPNELASSVQHLSLRRSSFQTTAPPKRSPKDNGELDIFSAEKYFSGTLDVQDCPELLMSSAEKKKSDCNQKKLASESRSSTYSETIAYSHRTLLRNSRQNHQPSSAARHRSFLNFFSCSCLKKNAVKEEDEAVDSSDRSSKLDSISKKSLTVLNSGSDHLQSESSSDLFEISSISMSSHPVYEPSEASIEWSILTASAANLSVASPAKEASEGKVRRSSKLLTFGCASEKAARVTADKVGSLDRYHVMVDLDPAGTARTAAAGPRRAWLG